MQKHLDQLRPQILACSMNMGIDWPMSLHKIQMPHACIVLTLLEEASVVANRSESLHACRDPQRFQMACKTSLLST